VWGLRCLHQQKPAVIKNVNGDALKYKIISKDSINVVMQTLLLKSF